MGNAGEHRSGAPYRPVAAFVDALVELRNPHIGQDPSGFLAWLRENDPVHFSAAGRLYLVSRHADVEFVFSDPAFRSMEADEIAARVPLAQRSRAVRRLFDSVAVKNPPEHTRLRRLISRDFTARRIMALRPAAERRCDHLLDLIVERLDAGEIVDIHGELSAPFVQHVFGGLFGIPDADFSAVATPVGLVLRGFDPAATDAQLAMADDASDELDAFFADLVARRRTSPTDDLISALVSAHDGDPDELTQDELVTMLWGLLLAGFETSQILIDNGVVAMLRHPEQATWLDGGPARVASFVAELVRYESPSVFPSIARITSRDVEIGGVKVPEGSDVRPLIFGANRDPAVFTDPERFDPSRDASAAVTFARGIHYCVGAQLARMESEVLLPRVYARLPHLDFAEPPTRTRLMPLRGFSELRVLTR